MELPIWNVNHGSSKSPRLKEWTKTTLMLLCLPTKGNASAHTYPYSTRLGGAEWRTAEEAKPIHRAASKTKKRFSPSHLPVPHHGSLAVQREFELHRLPECQRWGRARKGGGGGVNTIRAGKPEKVVGNRTCRTAVLAVVGVVCLCVELAIPR